MFSYMKSSIKKRKKNEKKGLRTVIFQAKIKKVFLKWLVGNDKKISVCPGFLMHKRKYHASMTVEAAFVLPFFLFAIVNLMSIMEIYRLQSNLSAAMHNTSKKMAIYAHMLESESSVINDVYAGLKVKNELSEAYLNGSPAVGGAYGIMWQQSEFMKADCIDLVAFYRVAPVFRTMGFPGFTMCNRTRTRAWTGYDNASECIDGYSEQLVYITPHGSAYHLSKNCSYLHLSIQAVDKSLAGELRNKDGSIFYPCEECSKKGGAIVFITDYGNRYHSTLECSGLKRTVNIVPLSEAEGRSACSKCGR